MRCPLSPVAPHQLLLGHQQQRGVGLQVHALRALHSLQAPAPRRRGRHFARWRSQATSRACGHKRTTGVEVARTGHRPASRQNIGGSTHMAKLSREYKQTSSCSPGQVEGKSESTGCGEHHQVPASHSLNSDVPLIRQTQPNDVEHHCSAYYVNCEPAADRRTEESCSQQPALAASRRRQGPLHAPCAHQDLTYSFSYKRFNLEDAADDTDSKVGQEERSTPHSTRAASRPEQSTNAESSTYGGIGLLGGLMHVSADDRTQQGQHHQSCRGGCTLLDV